MGKQELQFLHGLLIEKYLLLTNISHSTQARTSESPMKNETSYLSEAEIIRQAEQERSKAIAEFFTRLFSRHESANLPLNPIPAE